METALENQTTRKLTDLLKTVVERLKAAHHKIRELETAQTPQSQPYLSPIELTHALSGFLVAGSKGLMRRRGVEVELSTLYRYSHRIYGVAQEKVSSVLDLLADTGLAILDSERVYFQDLSFVEELIQFINVKHAVEPARLSARGCLLMAALVDQLSKCKKDSKTGLTTLNYQSTKSEDLTELNSLGFLRQTDIQLDKTILITVQSEEFVKNYRLMLVLMALQALNGQKIKTQSQASH